MGFGRFPRGGSLFPARTKYPQPDLEEIKSFIDQSSVSIRYWKSMKCPCATPATGQSNVACAQCRGLGFVYDAAEVDESYQRAQVHSRRSNKAQKDGGTLTTGYASITFKQGIIPADGDLVQVCADREVVNDEYHIVGSKLQDGSTAETLRFRDVFCVEQVKIFDQTTKRVFNAAADSWSFDAAQRRVVFSGGQSPGSRYSVRYQARPEYVLLGDTAKPLLRVGHDDELPEPYRTRTDIIFPYNCQALRLDRAIIQRLRGAADLAGEPTTSNSSKGRGPFLA